MSVWQTAPGIGIDDLNASPSDYFTFREENHTFQQFGIWDGDSVSVTGLAAPEQVPGLDVTQARSTPSASSRFSAGGSRRKTKRPGSSGNRAS